MTNFIHILSIFIFVSIVRSESDIFSEFVQPDHKITRIFENKVENFYTTIDQKIINNDISIIANIENSRSAFVNPVIYISKKPFPSNNLNSEWICGQLGKESCTIPRKYLSPEEKLYFGIKCDNCKVSLALTYAKNELLQEGEQKTFHLNKGDKKVFIFQSLNNDIEFVNIKTFNMKMTNYILDIKIVNEGVENKRMLEGLVSHDWVGGQQFLISNRDPMFSASNKYKVIIMAQDNGVFTIEARTSNTIVPLADNMIKFENLKPNHKTCYQYDIPQEYKDDNLMIKTNVIKGNTRFLLSPRVIPKRNQEFPVQMMIGEKSNSYELPLSTRQKLQAESGVWFICVESKKMTSFYTLQVYLNQFTENNSKFQKNLVSLLKNDNTYNLEDHQILSKRLLLQDTATINNTNATTTSTSGAKTLPKDTPTGIPINGAGVAGIFTFILFLVILLIGVTCIDSIFVSTKFVEHPLLLGKVEY